MCAVNVVSVLCACVCCVLSELCIACVQWACNGRATGMRRAECVRCVLRACVWSVRCVSHVSCVLWVCNGHVIWAVGVWRACKRRAGHQVHTVSAVWVCHVGVVCVQWACNGCACSVLCVCHVCGVSHVSRVQWVCKGRAMAV